MRARIMRAREVPGFVSLMGAYDTKKAPRHDVEGLALFLGSWLSPCSSQLLESPVGLFADRNLNILFIDLFGLMA